MSSAVVSTSAALGRPFVFDAKAVPEVSLPGSDNHQDQARSQESPIARVLQSTINNQKSKIPPASVTPASQLDIRPAPEMVSSGIPALDSLTGGLPRGCLTEICGPASSGRTTLLLAALAAATQRGECCAVVDASDALDPQSAAASGVELDRLLWIRCGEDAPKKSHTKQNGCPISRASLAREVGTSSPPASDFDCINSRQSEHCLEQVLRATDLLLESGGFGMIILDLGDLPQQAARRIPLTTWFRFRRAVENKPTILLAIEHHPIAGSCSSLLLQLGASDQERTKRKQSEFSLKTVQSERSDSSREAAAEESPARQCRVAAEQINESRKDGTIYPTCPPPQIVHPPHAQLFTGFDITAELIRSRLDRKPARSVAFATTTAWAG
jgi:recA bacterial DNA recombination protein